MPWPYGSTPAGFPLALAFAALGFLTSIRPHSTRTTKLRLSSGVIRIVTLGLLFLTHPVLAQARGGGISLAGVGHDVGGATASVFIVEFADFGCGYCARFNVETYPKIDSAYIRKGIVRWKVVPFVTGMFRNSREVAEAAECAAQQGAFLPMHDHVYVKRREWQASRDIRALVMSYARELKLEPLAFRRCLDHPETRRRIQRNDGIAQQLGIRGTPFFVVNGRAVPGAAPFDVFQQVIQQAIIGGR